MPCPWTVISWIRQTTMSISRSNRFSTRSAVSTIAIAAIATNVVTSRARTRETLLSLRGDCFHNSGFQSLGQLLAKHSAAEIVSLRLVTLVSREKRQLFFRFHALSNHRKLKASAEPDHCLHDDDFVGHGGDLTDERLVDLEGINGKLPEIAQAGVPRAEVIDRNLHPSLSQCRENGCGGLGMLHQNAFGQLQFKKSRIQPRVLENREYAVKKALVSQLHRGDVYRHRPQGKAGVCPSLGLLAGLPKNPGADRQNQAAVFRNGNKLSRRDRSPSGMGARHSGS